MARAEKPPLPTGMEVREQAVMRSAQEEISRLRRREQHLLTLLAAADELTRGYREQRDQARAELADVLRCTTASGGRA